MAMALFYDCSYLNIAHYLNITESPEIARLGTPHPTYTVPTYARATQAPGFTIGLLPTLCENIQAAYVVLFMGLAIRLGIVPAASFALPLPAEFFLLSPLAQVLLLIIVK